MEKFSDSDLLEAMQVLWDHCRDSLEKLGVEYVHRRASDERSLLDAVLTDIRDLCLMQFSWTFLTPLINWILMT